MKKIVCLLILVSCTLRMFATYDILNEIKEGTTTVDGIRYELRIAECWDYDNHQKLSMNLARVISADDDMENPSRKLYTGVVEIKPLIVYNDKEFITYDIGEKAFLGCADLEKVILPEGIKEVLDYAFAECNNLDVNIPESLEFIHSKVFEGTTFKEIPDLTNVVYFKWDSFSGSKIKNVTFGPNLQCFYIYSLRNSDIENIYFLNEKSNNESLFEAHSHSFSQFDIRELRLPERKLHLGSEFCYECPELERIIFPNQDFIRDCDDCQLLFPIEGRYTQTNCLIAKCPKIKEIVVLSSEPPKFHRDYYAPTATKRPPYSEMPIIDDHSQCVLKVPQGSEDLYRADPVWGRFERIEGFAPGEYTGISEAPVAEVESEVTPVYYNLQGMQVKEPVKGQLYIRRTGAKTAKIAY